MIKDFKTYLKHRSNIEAFIKKVDKLELKTDDWDAVSFFRNPANGSYRFLMIKYTPMEGEGTVVYDMSENGLGHIFYIIDNDSQGNIVMQEAALGDPTYIFLHNFVRAGCNGYLIKKCPQGIKMAHEIYEEAKKTLQLEKKIMVSNNAIIV